MKPEREHPRLKENAQVLRNSREINSNYKKGARRQRYVAVNEMVEIKKC